MRALACLLTLCLAWPAFAAAPRELSWDEMIPPGSQQDEEPPQAIHDPSLGANQESAPAAQQQQPAAPVVDSLNGEQVKLPGYVVPLEISEEGQVTEFLLVPYYGACIHVPPPPSNQIVHVRSAEGIRLDALWQPFWIEGALKVEHSDSELAAAGYAMDTDLIRPYE